MTSHATTQHKRRGARPLCVGSLLMAHQLASINPMLPLSL
jgi:hypothetical protein